MHEELQVLEAINVLFTVRRRKANAAAGANDRIVLRAEEKG